jgi:hypothetical protein
VEIVHLIANLLNTVMYLNHHQVTIVTIGIIMDS